MADLHDLTGCHHNVKQYKMWTKEGRKKSCCVCFFYLFFIMVTFVHLTF